MFPALKRRRSVIPLNGLQLWLDANSVNQADNTTMASWQNLAPTGATVTQATGASQPSYRNTGGVRYVQNNGKPGFGIQFGSAIAPDESTTFIVARNTTASQTGQCLFHLGPQDASAAAQTTYQFMQTLGQVCITQSGYHLTGMAMPAAWGILTTAGSVSGAGLPEGAGAWVYLNGQRSFRKQTTNGQAWTAVAAQSLGYLGSLGPGGQTPFIGDYRCVIHYNRRLAESEVQRVHAYLSATYGIALVAAPTKNLVLAIDSQTVGYTGTTQATASGYADQLLLAMGTGVRSYNMGVVGQTLVTAIAGASTYDALYDSTVAKNIFVPWGGTNDMANVPSNPTAAYNNLVTLSSGRRTRGFKSVVVTALPRGAVAQYETDRASFNTSVNSTFATFADAKADVGGDATIGAAGAQNNATNYQADAIHLTTAGYAIAEGLILTAVNSV